MVEGVGNAELLGVELDNTLKEELEAAIAVVEPLTRMWKVGWRGV
jgi:hypothetical protein